MPSCLDGHDTPPAKPPTRDANTARTGPGTDMNTEQIDNQILWQLISYCHTRIDLLSNFRTVRTRETLWARVFA